jgi:hypothetical protein
MRRIMANELERAGIVASQKLDPGIVLDRIA